MNIEAISKEEKEIRKDVGDEWTLSGLEGEDEDNGREPKRIGEESDWEDGANSWVWCEVESIGKESKVVSRVPKWTDRNNRSSPWLWIRHWS